MGREQGPEGRGMKKHSDGDVQVICRECGWHLKGPVVGRYVRWETCSWCRAKLMRPEDMNIFQRIIWRLKGAPHP